MDLQKKEECPQCHFVFVSGFDPLNIHSCPNCRHQFTSGKMVDHGKGCSVCLSRYHGTNNVYFKDGCPALMSDARFITYYNSANELTETMRKMNGFKSANQFRTFMQANADLLMTAERNYINKEYTCNPKTACSEGWYNLWTQKGGYWAKNYAS